jgi:hypothetical protein
MVHSLVSASESQGKMILQGIKLSDPCFKRSVNVFQGTERKKFALPHSGNSNKFGVGKPWEW